MVRMDLGSREREKIRETGNLSPREKGKDQGRGETQIALGFFEREARGERGNRGNDAN